jgi:hypothetical protein
VYFESSGSCRFLQKFYQARSKTLVKFNKQGINKTTEDKSKQKKEKGIGFWL